MLNHYLIEKAPVCETDSCQQYRRSNAADFHTTIIEVLHIPVLSYSYHLLSITFMLQLDAPCRIAKSSREANPTNTVTRLSLTAARAIWRASNCFPVSSPRDRLEGTTTTMSGCEWIFGPRRRRERWGRGQGAGRGEKDFRFREKLFPAAFERMYI